eukprot:m.18522 g.18522  ORF g.18522 m.18522 type:complete len:259 (-) comp5323_c0_seq1:274-1050(-)
MQEPAEAAAARPVSSGSEVARAAAQNSDAESPQIGDWVAVTRVDGVVVQGVLYTVDPETSAVFLVSHAPDSPAAAVPPATPHEDPTLGGQTTDDAKLTSIPINKREAGETGLEPGATTQAGALQVCVVMGHAVASIRCLPTPSVVASGPATSVDGLALVAEADALLQARADAAVADGTGSEPPSSAPRDLADQKAWALARLKEHRIPCVAEAERLVLLEGVATVIPPYTAAAVVSSNAIVLRRVRALLDSPRHDTAHQ